MTDHDGAAHQHDDDEQQDAPALPRPARAHDGEALTNVQHGEPIDYSRLPFGPAKRGGRRLVPHALACGTLPQFATRAKPAESISMRRLAQIIEDTVALLPDDDRQARIAYCRRTGKHGVRVERVGDGFRLMWGGRPLATLDADLLTDPSLQVATATYVDAVPDSPAELGVL